MVDGVELSFPFFDSNFIGDFKGVACFFVLELDCSSSSSSLTKFKTGNAVNFESLVCFFVFIEGFDSVFLEAAVVFPFLGVDLDFFGGGSKVASSSSS